MIQLFVYGSLRKGMYNYERYLKGKSNFVANGVVKGELYALHDVSYPALLMGDEDILGEIYEVDEDVAHDIDVLEGYVHDASQNDYNKVLMEVYVDSLGQSMLLPVYVFNLEREDNVSMLAQRITCNDYVTYYLEKKEL